MKEKRRVDTCMSLGQEAKVRNNSMARDQAIEQVTVHSKRHATGDHFFVDK